MMIESKKKQTGNRVAMYECSSPLTFPVLGRFGDIITNFLWRKTCKDKRVEYERLNSVLPAGRGGTHVRTLRHTRKERDTRNEGDTHTNTKRLTNLPRGPILGASVAVAPTSPPTALKHTTLTSVGSNLGGILSFSLRCLV